MTAPLQGDSLSPLLHAWGLTGIKWRPNRRPVSTYSDNFVPWVFPSGKWETLRTHSTKQGGGRRGEGQGGEPLLSWKTGMRHERRPYLSVYRAQVAPAQQSPMPRQHCGGHPRGLSRPSRDAVAVPVAVAWARGELGWASGLHAVLLQGPVGLTPHPRHLVDLHRGLGRVLDVHLHQ